MAGKNVKNQINEAKVMTNNGSKDVFALLVSSALHKHCATLYSSASCIREGVVCNFIECSCGGLLHGCKIADHANCCLSNHINTENAQILANSDFTLVSKLSLEDTTTPHKHCETCFSFTRCTRDGDSCDFKECSCGAVLHWCKLVQHAEICPHEQVPCINAVYGCDRIMAREKCGTHLVDCAANVIMCKAEWNRWPLYSVERRRHIPFRQRNPHAEQGQLDYDLALRDGRMLENLAHLPRRTKLSLRNYLTRRYPAVPIPSAVMKRAKEIQSRKDYESDLNNEADCIDAGDDLTYIGARKKNAFNEQMQRWQEDLDSRLKGKKIPPKYWEFPEMEKGNIHKHCAYCVDINCAKSNDVFTSYDDIACNMIECRQECGAKYHNCKSSEHLFICPNYDMVPDDYSCMFRGMNSGHERSEAKKKQLQIKANKELYMTLERTWPEVVSTSIAKLAAKSKAVIPVPPPIPANLYTVCPLDIRLDTVTRLQTKPRAMYTFVCAQEFKRRDYGWHYKNIHNDIHGGLNNWIEHRCPLSVYGCGFSSRRMFPHNLNTTLVYSPVVESFGISMRECSDTSKKSIPKKPDISTGKKSVATKPQSPAKKNVSIAPQKKSKMLVTDLPSEMLEKIFRMLDSFSLCNLAVTCLYFREICCSLLDSQGCVSLQWERVKESSDKYHWQIAYKRWFFSPSINPIEKWSFTCDEGAITEHLKVCPYNTRVTHLPIPKDHPIYSKVLEALEVKMKAKRQSEWFIK